MSKSTLHPPTKKKKKNKDGGDKSEYGDGSESARSRMQEVAEEVKVEQKPVEQGRPKKQFIQPEKITLMDEGVDLLRKQLYVWDENRKKNAFYTILYEYDFVGAGEKHKSPTKRLIE